VKNPALIHVVGQAPEPVEQATQLLPDN